MPGEPDSVRRLVESLTGEALKQFLNGLRHHVEVQRRVVRGQLRQEQVNVAYVKYALREGAGYRDEVGMLTARYYRDLLDVGARYSERFYEQVLEEPPSTVGDGSRAGGLERESLELHGPPGHEVVRRVALENTDSDEAEVTFELGECRGPDGIPFTAPLAVQPSRLTILPGERAEITLRLALLPSLFVPGNVYGMSVDVLGQQELALDLVIWAEEDGRLVATPPSAEAPSSTAGGPPYEVRCLECGRTFARARRNSRLNAHKAPDGKPCPGRSGELVGPGEGASVNVRDVASS